MPTSTIHPEHSEVSPVTAHPGSNVNVNRFSLPKDARDLIVAIVMALSISTSIIMLCLYLNSQRDLEQAYRDIKTQVWVKQDKEEEKFQKFVAGPYAQLAGELRANEILFKQCKKEK